MKFEIAEDLKQLADLVRGERGDLFFHLDAHDAEICFLWCDKPKKNRKKVVYADTEKVKEKLKAIVPYDFIITFYRPNCEEMSPEKLKVLMLHELLHCGTDEEGNMFIVPHDVEDFAEIVCTYGVDWATAELKALCS